MHHHSIVAGLLTLVFVTGCTVGPDYHAPPMAVPASFDGTKQADVKRWWQNFRDPHLDRLIDRAVKSNLDIQLAAARVREARSQLAVTNAGLFPTLTGTGAYSRSRQSKNAFGFGAVGAGSSVGTGGSGTGGTGGGTTGGTSGGTTGTGGSTAVPFAFGGHTENNLYQAGFDAGWEIDIFGGTRRAIEAAQADLQAQSEAQRDALVTLLSEVARNYIILRGFQNELAIVRQNIQAQQDTLDLTQSRFQAGIATDLDVARAEAQVQTTQAQVPTLRTQIQQAIHRLGVLLAQDPLSLERELNPPSPLPALPAAVPVGLPSDLLRRRPDVRRAERQLAAATARIGVATADLFPKFSLTGTLGLQSDMLKTLARSDSIFWSVGPTLSWNLFSAGRIQANIQVQNAREREALIQYRQAVLQSLQDVDDTLVAYNQEQVRRQTLRRAVASNQRAVDLAKQLNQAGVVDFLNVLTAQLALFQSQDQLAQSDQAVSADLVALYKALGGGWETFEEASAR